MTLRLVLLLALVAGLLALLRRAIRPRVPRKPAGRAIEPMRKCPDCGAYVLAGEPCPCTRQ